MTRTRGESEMKPIKTLDDIREAHDILSKEEESVEAELRELLEKESLLESRLRSMTLDFIPKISRTTELEELSASIAAAGKLAEEVSGKVKLLDLTKNRVSECQIRVSDLMDLKLCSEGVLVAIREEDHEQAAAHIHRFLAMDQGLLKLTVADMNPDNSSNLENSLKTLKEAQGRVKDIVTQKFDESVVKDDLASIERFFKLFPLLDLRDDGLNRFARYLRLKIATASEQNLRTARTEAANNHVIFADALTLLFEGIARTVEVHYPLIETYYGPGRLSKVVSSLQEECDAQAESILTEFRGIRNVHRIVMQIRDSMKLPHKASEKKIKPKDLDQILGELTLIQARTEMYFKFMRKRITADLETCEDKEKELTNFENTVNKSCLCRLLQDLMSDYILLEQYFMSVNIHKAMAQEEELNPDQLTSLMLDDIFYILKKTVERALSSQNVDGFCAVVNNACTLIESDLCMTLQNQLKLGFPSGYLDLTQAYNVLQTSFQQGKLQGGDSERQKALFLTYLNNADSGMDYVSRLQESLKQTLWSTMSVKTEYEKAKIENCLGGLPAAKDRLKMVHQQGLQQLRQSAVKPRIKPWVDTFGNHNINEEEFDNNEANDPFIQQLILNLDGLLNSFKMSLTPCNYDALISILSEEVTLQIEKVVIKSSFSRLGGLQFDKEVRSLVSFLTNVTTWSIRDKFSRLLQMATILNLEDLSEITDVWGSTTWKLTTGEVKQILNLRVDFKKEEVRRLML